MAERARSIRKRDKSIDRRAAGPASQPTTKLRSQANQRVYGPNNRSSIPDFLDNLNEFVGEKSAEATKDAAEQFMATGEEQEGFLIDSPMLQEMVAKRRGQRVAIEKLAEIEATAPRDIELAIDEGRNVDPNGYIDSTFAPLYEESDDPQYLQAINAARNEALGFVTRQTEALETGAALKQVKDDATGIVRAELVTAQRTPDKSMLTRIARGLDETDGLTTNEITDIMVSQVYNRMHHAESEEEVDELQSALKGWLSDHDKKGALARHETDITETSDAAKSAVQTRNNRLSEEETKARNDMYRDFWAGIKYPGEGERPTIAELNRNRDQLGEQMYMSLFKTLKDERHKDSLKSKQKDFEARIGSMIADGDMTSAVYHAMPEERRGEIDDILQEETQEAAQPLFAAAMRAERLATGGEDPRPDSEFTPEQEVAASVHDMASTLRTMRQTGNKPKAIVGYLDSAQPGTPQFGAAARTLSALQQEFGGKDPIPGVDASQLARLDTYNRMTLQWGFTPEEAATHLEQMQEVTVAESRTALNNNDEASDALEDTIEELGTQVIRDDVDVGGLATLAFARPFGAFRAPIEAFSAKQKRDVQNMGLVSESVKELAAIRYQVTQDAEESVTWAKERFLATHEPVDGKYVPMQFGITPGFGKAFDRFKPKVMDQLRADGAEFSEDNIDTRVIPVGDGTYGFQFVEADNPMRPIRNGDGDAVYVPISDINAWKTERQEDLRTHSPEERGEALNDAREFDQRVLEQRDYGPSSGGGLTKEQQAQVEKNRETLEWLLSERHATQREFNLLPD